MRIWSSKRKMSIRPRMQFRHQLFHHAKLMRTQIYSKNIKIAVVKILVLKKRPVPETSPHRLTNSSYGRNKLIRPYKYRIYGTISMILLRLLAAILSVNRRM